MSNDKTMATGDASYTTGHCAHNNRPGGCQLHNLQCGWPNCDRRAVEPSLATVKHGGCVQLGDSLTRFRCAGYDPTDGSGPIMVADREGPWVLAADVLSTSRNGNAAPEEAETSASKDDWFGDVLGSIGTVIPLGAALSAQPQYITDAYELGMRDGQNLSAQPSPFETLPPEMRSGSPDYLDYLDTQPSPGGQDALASLPLYRLADDAYGNRGLHRADTGSWVKLQDVERALAARQPVGQEPVLYQMWHSADRWDQCTKEEHEDWQRRGGGHTSRALYADPSVKPVTADYVKGAVVIDGTVTLVQKGDELAWARGHVDGRKAALLYSAPPEQAVDLGKQLPLIARALAEWHEDDGNVLWWAWCGHEWAGEPAWAGTPNDSDWPGYHTHWTPHPSQPTLIDSQAVGNG